MRIALLRADVERHAVGLEAELHRVLEHVHRHRGLAAEFARQRPFGADAVRQDAAEHARARRGAGDLLDLGLAIDREQAHAERIGARDVAFLLDRVAERDAIGAGTRGERHLDLRHGGRVEARAERGEQRQHLGRGIGLHGVEHARVGQSLGEGLIVLAHDVEVDDKTRPVVGIAAQEVADARGHGALLTRLSGRVKRPQLTFGRRLRATRRCCLGLERGEPFRTAGKDEKPLGAGPCGSARPRSPLRRCFKPRPARRARCAGFASGCRSSSERSRSFLRRLSGLLSGYLPTGTWPQARASLGDARHRDNACHNQALFAPGAKNFLLTRDRGRVTRAW